MTVWRMHVSTPPGAGKRMHPPSREGDSPERTGRSLANVWRGVADTRTPRPVGKPERGVGARWRCLEAR